MLHLETVGPDAAERRAGLVCTDLIPRRWAEETVRQCCGLGVLAFSVPDRVPPLFSPQLQSSFGSQSDIILTVYHYNIGNIHLKHLLSG